jgi:CHRD domain
MKRVLALAVLATIFGAAACDSNSTPTSTTSGSTEVTNFVAEISAANEVPAITGADGSASGTVNIKIFVAKDDSGTPKSASVDFVGSFSGFPAGSALTAAHIHGGAAGVNGGILVSTTIASGEVSFPNGTGTMSRTALSLDANLASQIIANPSGYYFNVHTAAHPGGAARGQLVKQ